VERHGAQPKAGDVGLCLYCATVLQYQGSPLTVKAMEGDELILVLADPKIRRAQRLILTEMQKRATNG
jgi:hypothetical protein